VRIPKVPAAKESMLGGVTQQWAVGDACQVNMRCAVSIL
jgi:hypothetical protein